MTETAIQKNGPAHVDGVAWFTLMVGLWSAFSTLLIASPETLDEIWSRLTGLPLAAEIVMWILMLPWALGVAVWQSSWDEWLRFPIIALLGAGWTAISKPRTRGRPAGRGPGG